MVRRARIKAPNQIYSVVTRVNNSEFCFSNYKVCEAFIDHLRRVKQALNFKLYAFVIMSSHVHLLIEPNDEKSDISTIMCHLNGKFSQKYNLFHKRKGHFWMQRFSSKLVERGRHLINSIIYFALNPVRAGITDNPLKFTYSSIHAITGTKYQDLVDELPQEFIDIIKEFLTRSNFLELLEKCVRVLKRFSFNLKKTKFDQRYRHLCGSYEYLQLYKHLTRRIIQENQ